MEKQYETLVKNQIEEAEKEESKALTEAKAVMGEEHAVALYDKIKAEETANQILARKKLLFGSSIETHRKEVLQLGEKGLQLSEEYKDKKAEILKSKDLTKQGKGKQLEELYNDYNARVKAVIDEQQTKIIKHQEERAKIAKETLETMEKEASINDFTEKDMMYIMYILENGNDQFLLEMLEEYEFNPFLLKLVNARDSKLPNRVAAKGTDPLASNSSKVNPNKLVIEHPLKSLTDTQRGIIPEGLRTKHRTRPLHELVPTQGVPSLDPWAGNGKVTEAW